MKITSLLPHGPSMVLIDEIVECSKSQAIISVDSDAVREWCWHRADGDWMPPWIAIELFAQAAAVARASSDRRGAGEALHGVIVRVQRMTFPGGIALNLPLSVSVAWRESVGGSLEVDGSLYSGERTESSTVAAAGRLLLKEIAAV